MPFTHTILQRVTVENRNIAKTIEVEAGALSSLSESIADAATNLPVAFTLDVSATKSFLIVSDQAVTVKTNSSGAPANTLVLVAGVPYIWHSSSYDTFKLTIDVTSLFVTNASGFAATLEIEALVDPTP